MKKTNDFYRATEGFAGGYSAPQNRTQETYARLADLARTLGPNGQLPTFADLRDKMGVSVATLNRALELLETHRMIHRRHGVGIFVSPTLGRKSIALVCSPRHFEGPEISPFWQILLEQVRRHATERDHEITLHFAAFDGVEDGLFDDLKRAVVEQRVQGVVGVGLSEAASSWLAAHGVAVVGFAGKTPYRVEVDYHRMTEKAALYLANVGCRRITVCTPIDTIDRLDLVQDKEIIGDGVALHIFDNEALRMGLGERPYPPLLWEQGYHFAAQVFGAQSDKAMWPDGIVSTSELFSQGILMGLQQCGVRAGDTVQLATHANAESPVLLPWADGITRFEVSPADLAQTLLEMLETLLAGGTPETPQAVHMPKILLQKDKEPLKIVGS